MKFDRHWRSVPVQERASRNKTVRIGCQRNFISVQLIQGGFTVGKHIVLSTEVIGREVREVRLSLDTGEVDTHKAVLPAVALLQFIAERAKAVQDGKLQCADTTKGFRLFSTNYDGVVETKDEVKETEDSESKAKAKK